MDLNRMRAMCHRDQWQADDLDWSVTPRPLPRDHEEAVVQYFTDMEGIELIAAELFKVQRDQARDPVLRDIFESFVVDEVRHAEVAHRLARHYDVHRYRTYRRNPHLDPFRTHFVEALHHLTPDIANAYITTGELLLDVALLRSLDDFVDDDMSRQAMRLINRDESRHIAIDYHMAGYYASEDYAAELDRQGPRSLAETARGWLAVTAFIRHARPFFRDVFFAPMDLTDPGGRRLLEAFKRIQLLAAKPAPAQRPFVRFMWRLQLLFNHPLGRRLFGPLIIRIMGVESRVIERLYSEEDVSRATRMSYDELAEEALAAKHVA